MGAGCTSREDGEQSLTVEVASLRDPFHGENLEWDLDLEWDLGCTCPYVGVEEDNPAGRWEHRSQVVRTGVYFACMGGLGCGCLIPALRAGLKVEVREVGSEVPKGA